MRNFPDPPVVIATRRDASNKRSDGIKISPACLDFMKDAARLYPERYHFLKSLIALSLLVVEQSKINWKITSWVRNSPSHSGESLDIAPLLAQHDYAHNRQSDPILTYRSNVQKMVINVAKRYFLSKADHAHNEYSFDLFIETHHLHIMAVPLSKTGGIFDVRVALFDVPVYKDSQQRRGLPCGHEFNPQSTKTKDIPTFTKVYIFSAREALRENA